MGLASSGQCTSEPKPPLRSLQAARTDFDSNYYLLLVWKRRITIFLFPLLLRPTGGDEEEERKRFLVCRCCRIPAFVRMHWVWRGWIESGYC